MNEKNTFIEEVTSDLRQEKLYKAFRRYAWIGILAIIAIVGGTAFNEYKKTTADQAARTLGEKIFQALEMQDKTEAQAALSTLAAQNDAEAIITLIGLSLSSDNTEARQRHLNKLTTLSNDTALSPLYQDLARLIWVITVGDTVSNQEKLDHLDKLSTSGSTFRNLAEEQRAFILIQMGKRDEALAILRQIRAEEGAYSGFFNRSERLIIALGEKLNDDTNSIEAQSEDSQ